MFLVIKIILLLYTTISNYTYTTIYTTIATSTGMIRKHQALTNLLKKYESCFDGGRRMRYVC